MSIVCLPASVVSDIAQYNNQQSIIDELIELNKLLLDGLTIYDFVKNNDLNRVKLCVKLNPSLSSQKDLLEISLQNKYTDMILFMIQHGFEIQNIPVIYDIAIMDDDVDFQLNIFSNMQIDINRLYIATYSQLAIHELEALPVEVFDLIINRPDYQMHNFVCRNLYPFIIFSVNVLHEYFNIHSVEKAKIIIQHPKTDINIKFNGKSLLQTAQISGFNSVVELLHDKMVMNAYVLC
eukprot:g2250.t1